MKSLFFILSAIFCCSCAGYPELLTVKNVSLERYAGKWYEIARLPNSFEKGLKCVTAEYEILPDKTIRVINQGRKIDSPQEIEKAVGKAWIPNPSEPGQLKVQFFWPFSGAYWIIDLDEKDYQYSLVGSPSRDYLWILSRNSKMDSILIEKLLQSAKNKGFAVEKMIYVAQDCGN